MTTKIFPSRHSPLPLLSPTCTLSWMSPSILYSCLITGQENGCIGITWYPSNKFPSSPSHFSSLTLSYSCLTRITHIRCCSPNSYAAVADANGTLMLLSVRQPHSGVTRMLTSMTNTPQTIVGVDWSHRGSSLACLRANAKRSTQLVLIIYSNLSHTQIGHTEVTFPRNVVRESMIASEQLIASQRIAWSQDDSAIFLTTPDHSVLKLSSQTWQITARLHLSYCTQLQMISSTQLLAASSEGKLSLYNFSSNSFKQLTRHVDNWVWSVYHEKLLAVTRQGNSCHLSVISPVGIEQSRYNLPTSGYVTSVSLSPDSTILSYTTGSYMCSLLLYTSVPTLSDLCMRTIGDTRVCASSLPQRLQEQVSMHHNVLFYPWCLSDAVELSVLSMEKRSGIGQSSRLLLVKKDHLGQELDVLRFYHSNKLWKHSVKLKKQSGLDSMLPKLLSLCITQPPKNCKIKWNISKSVFTLRTGANELHLIFVTGVDEFIAIFRGGQHRISMVEKTGLVIMKLIDGDIVTKISHDQNLFRMKLYKLELFSQLQILMIVLAFIIRNF
ncbi:hypothetical protein LOD99_12546 [Oopsacas minuta]|uniref:Uncharacterized protein n=1 Tax=Oopsacas minuta TaxID=111878 RepID=A0AAV7JCC5_9METZ|nr:hypothetical protein LOD99_12546 [Oopsacas minuta]